MNSDWRMCPTNSNPYVNHTTNMHECRGICFDSDFLTWALSNSPTCFQYGSFQPRSESNLIHEDQHILNPSVCYHPEMRTHLMVRYLSIFLISATNFLTRALLKFPKCLFVQQNHVAWNQSLFCAISQGQGFCRVLMVCRRSSYRTALVNACIIRCLLCFILGTEEERDVAEYCGRHVLRKLCSCEYGDPYVYTAALFWGCALGVTREDPYLDHSPPTRL